MFPVTQYFIFLTHYFFGFSRSLTNPAIAETIEKLHPTACGPVAQLGARFHGMEEVIGSIPIRSTKSFKINILSILNSNLN